jgi:hypothetical protein
MTRSPWVQNLFRPLAIGVMVGCIALSVVGLVRLFAPTWSGTYLVVGTVLAALEANYSYRLIQVRKVRGPDVLRFRAIEMAMFFIMLKIGSYVGDRWTDVVADVRAWPRQPWGVFDREMIFAFILALLSWQAATQTVRDLEQIGEPPERHRHYVPPLEKLTSRFFWGGAVLLVFAGITRIGIAALLDLQRPSVPGLVLNVLVYFLLGLVMLGQVRFTRLRVQWQAQRIKIADELPGRWARYSLILIALAALIAFLLPTGYTVGLLDVVATIIYVLSYAMTVIVTIISVILGLLLLPLARLLGRERTAPRREIPPLQLPQEGLGGPSIATPDWFEILRSLLFWAAVLGMAYYVIRSYLRDHPELLQALASLGPIRALRTFLSTLWRRLVGLAEAINERIPQGLALRRGRRGPAASRSRLFRLGALSPRERVLYYYLSILRRAGQQGFPRRHTQTPHEYEGTLGPHLPDARPEMSRLTRDFEIARYSNHPVGQDEERRVRTRWQRVKAALRALRQRDEGPATKDE